MWLSRILSQLGINQSENANYGGGVGDSYVTEDQHGSCGSGTYENHIGGDGAIILNDESIIISKGVSNMANGEKQKAFYGSEWQWWCIFKSTKNTSQIYEQ